MPTPGRNPGRVLLSVRIDSEVAHQARELCRNQAGSPLFLRLGTFVEAALQAHIAATKAKLEAGERPARRPPTSNNRL